ncbi:D-amino acid dehydrogenase [Halomonas denitrificans]|nr:D-amino acid dehydrogenase [Halomonas denitrificans]
MKIVVIGAGVVGATSALVLAERGADVTLVDAAPEPALGTSFANGSGITPGHAEPWNPPGTAQRLIGALLHRDLPYQVRPSALPGLLRWGAAFLRESAPGRYYANASHCIRLAVHSRRCLADLRERHGLAYDQVTEGSLELYRSPDALHDAVELRRRIGNADVEFDLLEPDALARLEPALAPVAGQFHAALLFPAHESGDARLFSREAVRRAAELGTRLRLGERVEKILRDNGRLKGIETDQGTIDADRVILCTGTDTGALLEPLGLRVPIYPVQGYSMTLDVAADGPAPRLPILDLARRFVTARLGPHRLRIAGLSDFTGGDTTLRPERLAVLKESAAALLPELADAIRAGGEDWTGLRPMTPDGPPLIGPTPIEGLWLNTGHGAMGWTMAAGSADVLADRLFGDAPKISAEGLDAQRVFG